MTEPWPRTILRMGRLPGEEHDLTTAGGLLLGARLVQAMTARWRTFDGMTVELHHQDGQTIILAKERAQDIESDREASFARAVAFAQGFMCALEKNREEGAPGARPRP